MSRIFAVSHINYSWQLVGWKGQFINYTAVKQLRSGFKMLNDAKEGLKEVIFGRPINFDTVSQQKFMGKSAFTYGTPSYLYIN